MSTKKGTFQDHEGNELRPDLPPQELLDKIKTVDGPGSGLNADLLDGKEASAFLQADPSGKLPAEKLPDTIDADTLGGKAANQFAQLDESGKLPVDSLPPGAKDTAAEILEKLKTVDGTGSGLDADLLDGKHASEFAASNHTHTPSSIGAASASHTHPASQITAGTLPTGVLASGGTDYTTSRLRNIKASTSDLSAGSSSLASGEIYLVYE